METFRKVVWTRFQRGGTELKNRCGFLPSKLYPQDLGDNELMVGIWISKSWTPPKENRMFFSSALSGNFLPCHLQKEISGKILIQYKIGVSPEQWSVLIWTSWGSGSCFSEITLRLLLLQLHFGAIFVLVLFRQGSGTAQRNWGVMEVHWNNLKTIFKLWSRPIPESMDSHLRSRKESRDSLSEYIQWFALLFASPHDQYFSFSLNSGINRSDFTETSGNICSYRKCESKRPGQRSKRKCGSKGQQAALGK